MFDLPFWYSCIVVVVTAVLITLDFLIEGEILLRPPGDLALFLLDLLIASSLLAMLFGLLHMVDLMWGF